MMDQANCGMDAPSITQSSGACHSTPFGSIYLNGASSRICLPSSSHSVLTVPTNFPGDSVLAEPGIQKSSPNNRRIARHIASVPHIKWSELSGYLYSSIQEPIE